jgi:hypothetical protein
MFASAEARKVGTPVHHTDHEREWRGESDDRLLKEFRKGIRLDCFQYWRQMLAGKGSLSPETIDDD